MAASGVEISEKSTVPLVGFSPFPCLLQIASLRIDDVCDGELNAVFGISIGIGWSKGAFLWDRDHVGKSCGISVHCRRRGKDNIVDIVFDHGAQQAKSAVDVDMVVVQRSLTALAHSLDWYHHQHRTSKNTRGFVRLPIP